jgi:hypothetical protein
VKSWLSDQDNIYHGTSCAARKNGWIEIKLFTKWFTSVFLRNGPSEEAEKGQNFVLFFMVVISILVCVLPNC